MPGSAEFAAGTVWLVGAGPGDPDLLTRKAERLIGQAEVIFHDALVPAAILALAGPDAALVSVGKRSGRHSKEQSAINDLLLAAARAGKRVVRLKGGDPSIFGRSAEEVAHLAAHGVAARICPGITAASAAAAGSAISLTLRGVARQLCLVTAHSREGEEIDWSALPRDATLAVYMGRAAAADIAQSLIRAGRAPTTPVMIAVNVSLPNERVIRGELSSLAFLVETIGERDPTLLLIGDAVRPMQASADGPTLATISEGQE